ncbi:hypothetical protein C8J56DRAFT_896392 [Mycena floridula]|nr:hypothetical protein C8J56DRAFT_896392 [Mycena floridula]
MTEASKSRYFHASLHQGKRPKHSIRDIVTIDIIPSPVIPATPDQFEVGVADSNRIALPNGAALRSVAILVGLGLLYRPAPQAHHFALPHRAHTPFAVLRPPSYLGVGGDAGVGGEGEDEEGFDVSPDI